MIEQDLHVFKALSDETRLRILALLSGQELCVCEIVEVLEMPQGKISRHLALLKQAGLTQDRREGVWIYYALGAADTPLKKRIRAYLAAEAGILAAVQQDRRRLESMAAMGTLCVPRPSNGVNRKKPLQEAH